MRRSKTRAARSPRWSTPTRAKSSGPRGATESNNLAIKGAAHFYARTKGKHIVTVKTEHKAVLDTMPRAGAPGLRGHLPRRPGKTVCSTSMPSRRRIRPDTILASVMFVNNEIGVIQDDRRDGRICREKGVIFHVDAAQATGKVEIDLQAAQGGPDELLGRTRPTAPRVSARCMCAASRASASRRRCTAAVTSAACARVRWPRTRLSAWARPSGMAKEEMAEENQRVGALRDASARAGCRASKQLIVERRPDAARAAQPEHQLQLMSRASR